MSLARCIAACHVSSAQILVQWLRSVFLFIAFLGWEAIFHLGGHELLDLEMLNRGIMQKACRSVSLLRFDSKTCAVCSPPSINHYQSLSADIFCQQCLLTVIIIPVNIVCPFMRSWLQLHINVSLGKNELKAIPNRYQRIKDLVHETTICHHHTNIFAE